jgi:hypothetical protein
MTPLPPEYLGDGVYAEWDSDHLKLMTGSHDNPDHVIYLELSVIEALQSYIKKIYGTNTTTNPSQTVS